MQSESTCQRYHSRLVRFCYNYHQIVQVIHFFFTAAVLHNAHCLLLVHITDPSPFSFIPLEKYEYHLQWLRSTLLCFHYNAFHANGKSYHIIIAEVTFLFAPTWNMLLSLPASSYITQDVALASKKPASFESWFFTWRKAFCKDYSISHGGHRISSLQ